MRKKFLIFFINLLIVMSLIQGCSPLDENPDTDNYTPLFPGDTSTTQAQEYTLYYNLVNQNYLVPELETLTIPESKRVELVLLQELVSGPKLNLNNTTGLINNNTRVTSVSDNGDILFVTLSNHFLTPPKALADNWQNDEELTNKVLETRKLALYSIVNTITELGRYSSVQIYIDYDGNGTGKRPTRKEMGLLGEVEEQLVEPVSRNTQVIFTPIASVNTIMQSISDKNWEKVIQFTSTSESVTEDYNELIGQLQLKDISLIEYNISSETVALNGNSAVVILSYTLASSDGTQNTRENVSLRLLQEEGLWKCSVISLNQIIIGEDS